MARELLAERPLAAELFAAVAVDFVAGRARVPWYDGAKRADWLPAAASALVGLGLGAVTVAAVSIAGRARPTFSGDPLSLVLATLSALAISARVELLARHLPDALLGDALSARWRSVVLVLAGGAPLALSLPQRPLALVVALASGALSVAWLRSHGALATVALRSGLVLGAATVFGDVRWARGGLAPLDVASGDPAVVFALVTALCAAFVTWRRGALATAAEPTKPSTSG